MEEIQIFISYASEDQDRVRVIYDKLVAHGFHPWLDREHLLPGQKWEPVIKQALKRSDFVLVCLSATSINKRGFLQKEIKQALEQADERLEGDVYLIPARLDDCEVPDALSEIQWVDLFDDNGWEQLVRALETQLSKLGKQMPSSARRSAIKASPIKQTLPAALPGTQSELTLIPTKSHWLNLKPIAMPLAVLLTTSSGAYWLYTKLSSTPVSGQPPVVTTSPIVAPTLEQRPNPTMSPTSAPSPQNTVSPERLRQQVAKAIGEANRLYVQGQFNQAIDECNRALRLDPGNREARELKGRILKTKQILKGSQ